MKGFQEFMTYPSRVDAILQRLDKVEARVFKEQAKEASAGIQGSSQRAGSFLRLAGQSADTMSPKVR